MHWGRPLRGYSIAAPSPYHSSEEDHSQVEHDARGLKKLLQTHKPSGDGCVGEGFPTLEIGMSTIGYTT